MACDFRSIPSSNDIGREYYSALGEGMSLLHGSRILLVAMMVAAVPATRAQQQSQDPQTPAGLTGESLPERFIGGIRDIFRSIFAPAPQAAPSAPQPAPAADANPQEQAARPAAAAEPVPVNVSPNASAAPLSLHSAIAKGDYANALKMIEQGTDIEGKDPGAGASALHYAVMKGEMPLVGLLVGRGADVNSRTKSGTTPLHTAVLYGRFEVAEYLLDKGSEVNAKSASGATPMSLATAAGYQRIAKMLRSRGAN